MSEIITIEKVEEAKSTKGTYKTITFGNRKASCFVDGMLHLLTVGATLEVEMAEVKKGDKTYHNITAAKISDKPATPPPSSTGRSQRSHEDFMTERASIERQTALKAAVELAGYNIGHGAILGAQQIVQVAGIFAAFIASGKMPALPSQPPAVPVGNPQEATKAEARPETAPRKQLPLNGATHEWQWFCTEVLKIKDMTVMKAMAILEIEKADQWAGTWDEALSKVKAARK